MKNNSRRNFLKRSILSLSSIAFISTPLFSFNYSSPSPRKILDKKSTLKSKAKGYFYAGMYLSAETLYLDMLKTYPNDISIYDGLSKVYSVQFKILERVSLYKKGYEKNLSNHLFYDRYAQSLRCLALGFPNVEKIYSSQNNGIGSIHQALLIYIRAINLFPDKIYLREHLLDVQDSLQKLFLRNTSNKSTSVPISPELIQQIQIFSMPIKKNWEITRSSKKKDRSSMKLKDVETAIGKVKTKKRRNLARKNEIICREANIRKETKSYLLPLFDENIRINKIDKAEEIYKRIIEIDPRESYCKGRLIKAYNKSQKIDQLINLYESQIAQKDDFWTFIGLGKSYLKKGNISKSPSYYLKAYAEYVKCRDKFNVQSNNLKGIICYGIAQSILKAGSEEVCRKEILTTLSEIGTQTNGAVLLCLYAESFIKSNKDKAEIILQTYTGQLESSKLGDDPIKFYIDSSVNRHRLTEQLRSYNVRIKSHYSEKSSISILKETLPALYALARLYKSQHNIEAYNKMIEQIALADGKSPLVKERFNN